MGLYPKPQILFCVKTKKYLKKVKAVHIRFKSCLKINLSELLQLSYQFFRKIG